MNTLKSNSLPILRNNRKTKITVLLCSIFLTVFSSASFVFPQSLLDNFNPRPNSVVDVILFQPDGKIIIGGGFTQIKGVSYQRVARINSDGTIDTSFSNPGVNSSRVEAIAIQPDGKIIIAGGFTQVGGQSRGGIARLNADGTLDTSFVAPVIGNTTKAVALQSDGKILIGGFFTKVGDVERNRIARLDSDGSLDNSFNPNADSTVFTITVLENDKILVGGGGFLTLAEKLAVAWQGSIVTALQTLLLTMQQSKMLCFQLICSQTVRFLLAVNLTVSADNFVFA